MDADKLRLAIDHDKAVKLVCPQGRLASIAGNIAICQRCGAHITLDELSNSLHRCAESLGQLIDVVDSQVSG